MRKISIPTISMNGDDPQKLLNGLAEAIECAYQLKHAIAAVEYDNGRNADNFEHAQEMRELKHEMISQANNIEVTLIAITRGIQKQMRK